MKTDRKNDAAPDTKPCRDRALIQNLLLLPTLMAGLGLVPADRVTAQTFTVLHHFDLFTEGGNPAVTEALTISGNTLYGATVSGGLNGIGGGSGAGTLFSLRIDGADFTVIHAFPPRNADGTNVDGETPNCTLKLAGTRLYGTATSGGTFGNGVLFSLNPDGTDFIPLYNFSGAPLNSSHGKHSPSGNLVLSGEALYGVTVRGGSPDYDGSVNGRVFAVNTNGTGTIPYAFPAVTWDGDHMYTPYGPVGGLALSGNKLYGSTSDGGYDNYGTVFAVNTDGSDYSTLHLFMNTNGATPMAPLVLSGNTLYGTTMYGGSEGNGVIFAIRTDGSAFTVLHSFTDPEGFTSQSGLVVSGDTLYGSTLYGGSTGFGTVFSMKTNGTDYTVLHSFERNTDGRYPSGLILAGGSLYGMTGAGGSFDYGTIFLLSLPTPQLAIIRSDPNIILTWPADAAGFVLQSTTNLASQVVWATVSPGPVVVNGQNAVTNPVSGSQHFYRLAEPAMGSYQ